MGALLSPSHGSMRDTSARVLKNLTPALLGSAKAGPGSHASNRAAQMIRSRTLQFACDALRYGMLLLISSCCGEDSLHYGA